MTVLTPCAEPVDADVPKPRLFIAAQAPTPPLPKPSLTPKASSQPRALQNLQSEDAHHGSALTKSDVETAPCQSGSS